MRHRTGRDLEGALTGGLILILLGVLFYLAQNSLVTITWSNWWAYFLFGLGIIVVIQGFVRYTQGGYFTGSVIGGGALMAIGLAFISGSIPEFWPLILIALGIVAIALAFAGRRRTEVPSGTASPTG